MQNQNARPRSAVIARRESRIIELRAQGLTLRKIAQKLRLTPSLVGQMASRLIHAGRLTSKWSTISSHEKVSERDAQMIALGAAGLSVPEIAGRLGLARSNAYHRVRMLVETGRMQKPPRKPYERKSEPLWQERNHERIEVIIRMWNEGKTFKEMGAALGITPQRANVIAVRIKKIRGPTVFDVSGLFTLKEAAGLIGRLPSYTSSLVRKGLVSSVKKGNRRYVDAAGLEALRGRAAGNTERACIDCGLMFLARTRTRCQRCISKCEYRKRLASGPEKLTGWRREVWQQLHNYSAPADDQNLTLGCAVAFTGLSKMQLRYFSEVGAIKLRLHPSKMWRGQPLKLYPLSQLVIVKKIREQFTGAKP